MSDGASHAAASKKKGKKRKVYQSLSKAMAVPPPIKSRRVAREVTSQFHVLSHKIDAIKQDTSKSEKQKKAEIAELEKKLDEIGGRKAYQEASVISTKHFRSSKFVFQTLTKLDMRPKKGEAPIPLLEVGAINRQLLSCPWLATRAIDLMQRDEGIEAIDFFDIRPEHKYRVVVCSMVLNCVPDARKRGDMIRMSYQHLQPGGLYFVMIPLLCLTHSPYMTSDLFMAALRHVGFEIVERKDTPKIAFICARVPTQEQKESQAPQSSSSPSSSSSSSSSSEASPSSSSTIIAPSKPIPASAFKYPPKVIVHGKSKTRDFAICFEDA